jgi:arsenate reductase
MRVLVLCTGNSARSQMAEGFLKSFDARLEVHSAGTKPSARVHPKAVAVMKEAGIDISQGYPKKVDQFLAQPFDYVITVCADADRECPVFEGRVEHRIHLGFEDPVKATGSDEEVLAVFRRIRDEIRARLYEFYVAASFGR